MNVGNLTVTRCFERSSYRLIVLSFDRLTIMVKTRTLILLIAIKVSCQSTIKLIWPLSATADFYHQSLILQPIYPLKPKMNRGYIWTIRRWRGWGKKWDGWKVEKLQRSRYQGCSGCRLQWKFCRHKFCRGGPTKKRELRLVVNPYTCNLELTWNGCFTDKGFCFFTTP